MPELRWILIVCGAALLLGIYLRGRRSSGKAAASEDALLRTAEPWEPRSVHAYRDEPAAEDDGPTDESSVSPDTDLEPIVANRRHWNVDAPVVIDDSDYTEEGSAPAEPLSATDKPAWDRETRRTRIEPRLGAEEAEPERAPQPVEPAREPEAHAAAAAPTLSMSSTPPPRRSDRRKIMALRIAAGAQRFPGEQLLAAMEAEGLQHGKYDVFHRIDDIGSTMFSVASMVEPGTFDPLRMAEESFPGITLFTQFPGPCESMLAFNELVLSARRLQEVLGGTLQDERGVPLTIHRLERMRQDIRDFDQGHGRDIAQRAEPAPSPTP